MTEIKMRTKQQLIAQKKCDKFNEIPEESTFKHYPFKLSRHLKIHDVWDYARTVGQAFVSADGRAVVFISDNDDYVPISSLELVL